MMAVGLGRAMQDEGKARAGLACLLEEHTAAMGRVAMALLGDAPAVERVLEQVARDAGAKLPPEPSRTRAWLFGLVRSASAAQLSKLPLRTRPPASSGTSAEVEARA